MVFGVDSWSKRRSLLSRRPFLYVKSWIYCENLYFWTTKEASNDSNDWLRLHHWPQFFIFCWRLQSRGGHSFTQSTFLSVSMVRTQPNRIFQGSSFLAKKVTKSRDEKAIILLLNENHRKTKYVLCWWHNQSSPNITKLPKKLPQQLFT